MLADDYIGKRSPHVDNCIADYMDTSKSTRSNYYGWSWSNDVAPAFTDYVNQTPLKYGCYDTWSPQGVRWETFRGMAAGSPWGIYRGWSFQLAINAPASIDYPSVSATGEYTIIWPAAGGAASYQLERSDDGGNNWSEIYSNANTSYSENVDDGSYRYRVKASNSTGSSGWTTGTWDCVVDANSPTNEYSSSDVPQVISDYTTIDSNMVISQSAFITDINVKLNITHGFDSDLDVFLIAPDTTRIELFTDVGNGANFTNTIIDDEAATAITSGASPFTGTYRPEGSLAALDGKNFNGTWTLEITDDASGDTGTLNSWSLINEEDREHDDG